MADDDEEISAEMRRLEREMSLAMRELVTEVVAKLVEATPVETGHARANWIPSIGGPISEEDGFVQEARNGDRRTNAGAGQRAGLREIVRYNITDGDVFISNNVPYITILNTGTSDQAPRFWIEQAIEQGADAVQARYR
jgi:hypothetical protein